jgi:uncharacterized protein with PIN domain
MDEGSATRFVVDHMLIKLGKYLRILGYDAEWNTCMRTHELVLKANAEHRVFVTRNRHLSERYPKAGRALTVRSEDPVEQLSEVVQSLGLDTTAALFSKCIRCNVALDQVETKETIKAKVHPNVYAGYDRFYTCPRCGTVFWKGSHVRNTCRKLGIGPACGLCAAALWGAGA